MDIEGLEKVISNNHKENLRKFEDIKFCIHNGFGDINKRIEDAEEDIERHDRSIVRIKTIGSAISGFLAMIWGGLVFIFKG
jgi:hypothetical protein